MPVRLRPDLAALPSYAPGTMPPVEINLAGNEVPTELPGSVRDAINDAAARSGRYPDPTASALVARLARRLDVDTRNVVVGCGSVTLCHQAVQATCAAGEEVLFPRVSFEAYPVIARVVGATPRSVPLADDWSPDLPGMLAAVGPATRVVFLCTPNNPTGAQPRAAALREFLAAVPPTVLVILDEAYREFVVGPDAFDGVSLAREQWRQGRDNVAVLRTFSKAHGLAGLRLGYLIGPGTVTEALGKVQVPFGVSSVAQAAALASLDAEDDVVERCRTIVRERTRVRRLLHDAGHRVPPSQGNFLWLPFGDRSADFAAHCRDNGIAVRVFGDDGVRVTIGTATENDAFVAAARTYRRRPVTGAREPSGSRA
ncbi:histidinol-phosphate transaminase [Micromonospora sp. WMMD882]|uniref:histidinol-phosphate transaminase n=1 Tax=Micromonospora sp. WMMD882 TaxID=3015151 RepID=UPI00248C8B86|nr:histidinol-phosphate transaminase [Micromonospora sp. WMMD882]WBB77302.1 histidinol-phosphate transaminase [Micromonospora sp. WMMD882]